MGKEKVKERKDKRLNEITEPPEEQWKGRSWEQWSEQSRNTEADTASWRDDDWYTADSNSQTSAAAEEFQHASVIESFEHDRLDFSQRTVTFGIDTAACNIVVLANHPAARGYLVHKDSLLGPESQWPSRAGKCRRPLMAVTVDDGLWSMGLFWTAKTRFQF